MDKWYIIISGLLLLLAAVLFIRLIQYKRQMRIFAAKLQKRLHGGVDQVIAFCYQVGDGNTAENDELLETDADYPAFAEDDIYGKINKEL